MCPRTAPDLRRLDTKSPINSCFRAPALVVIAHWRPLEGLPRLPRQLACDLAGARTCRRETRLRLDAF